MEDTLREKDIENERLQARVLILVLMEDTLRVLQLWQQLTVSGLNPCFNGRYSQS